MVPLKCRIMDFDVKIHILLTSNICAENMLFLNKTQVEYNFTVFNAIFGLDVNDVKSLKS